MSANFSWAAVTAPTPHTTTAARVWDQSTRGWVWVRAWCQKETT